MMTSQKRQQRGPATSAATGTSVAAWIKSLNGQLPICAGCKKIRHDDGA